MSDEPTNKPVEPPATPDLTKDDNSKEIRRLQDKVVTLETSLKKAREDLDSVAPIIKKLSEMPPVAISSNHPATAASPTFGTLLEQIDALIFKSKAK